MSALSLCALRRRVSADTFPTTDLVHRWRFGQASTALDGSTAATTTGDLVRYVPDVHGSAPLLVSTDGDRPTYRTDLGAGAVSGVRFASGTWLRTDTGTPVTLAATRTYVGVFKVTASDDTVVFGRRNFSISNTCSEYAYYADPAASDALVAVAASFSGVSGQYPTSALGVFVFSVDQTNGAAGVVESYLDGTLTKTATSALGASAPTYTQLGVNIYDFTNDASATGAIDMIELAVFDAALGSTERAALQSYYATTYGV